MNRSDLESLLLVACLVILILILFGVGVTPGKAF